MAHADTPDSGRDGHLDDQIRRVEQRLVQETHLVAPDVLHEWITDIRTRFATARIQTFVPIFVDREVRSRLRSVAEAQ